MCFNLRLNVVRNYKTHAPVTRRNLLKTSYHQQGDTVFQNNNPTEPQKETINVAANRQRYTNTVNVKGSWRRLTATTTRQRTGNCSQIAVDDELLSNFTVKYCLKLIIHDDTRSRNAVFPDTSRHASKNEHHRATHTEW